MTSTTTTWRISTTRRGRSSRTRARATSEPTVPFALALGANAERAEATLRDALRTLRAALGPLDIGPLYRTRAVSPIPQPDFLNTAAVGESSLGAELLLALAKRLELAAGRRHGARWGPRPLDIDLLVCGGRVSSAPELTLPHPRLAERRFVLQPLSEIAPDLRVPPDGRTVAELLAALPPAETGEVVRVGWSEVP